MRTSVNLEKTIDTGALQLICDNSVNAFGLGGLSIGQAWSDYVPALNKEQAFAFLDAWWKAGGIHIDTSNHYQNEESETWIGEWMQARGNRDHMVIGTKFTSTFRGWSHGKNESANLTGNHRKSVHVSLRESLSKLQTDYVDILYIHFWDFTTTVEELMDSLDHYVKQGKVLYLGASNLPAWLVAGCNSYAKTAGKTPFVIYQGRWSVLDRDIEQDIVPMCRAYGMAIQPWSALGQGRLQTRTQMEKLKAEGGLRNTPEGPDQSPLEVQMSAVLEEIAKKHNVEGITPIALAWLYAKYTYCFPVIGMNNEEQMKQNIDAIGLVLDDEDVAKIDAVNPTSFGYPNWFNGDDPHVTGKATSVPAGQVGTIDWVVDRKVYSSQM